MNIVGRTLFSAALIGMAVSGHAWAICVSSTGVFGTATQTGATSWTYDFTVQNGCAPNHQPLLTNFYIPYFADAGIASITVPLPDTTSTTSTISWTAAIEPNNNIFNLAGAGVIDFQVTASPELQVGPNLYAAGVGYYGASGFSFTANYGDVKGPYAILQTPYNGGTYTGTTMLFGDPPIPGSPNTIAALALANVPIPGAAALLASGLFLMTIALRRRAMAA
ncbi:MAG: hypothetical protein ACYC9L_15105 [Sulfuricaulis sp.]